MNEECVVLNYAICFDGTWNETNYIPEKNQAPTNVLEAYRLIEAHSKNSALGGKAITSCHYYDGPGTKPGNTVLGGIMAVDLGDALVEAYRALVAEYFSPLLTDAETKRDFRLFLFGFSRGAYRAHVFSWFLNRVGMTSDITKIKRMVEAFLRGKEKEIDALCVGNKPSPRIAMMGLWDVVRNWHDKYDAVHEGEKSPLVDRLFHAMAADEKRLDFGVMHYKPDVGVEQCWFSGVHSEVGGGFANDIGLSKIAFTWVMNHAKQCGLGIGEDISQVDIDFTKHENNDAPWYWLKWRRLAKNEEKFHKSIQYRVASTLGEKDEYKPQLRNYREYSQYCAIVDDYSRTSRMA